MLIRIHMPTSGVVVVQACGCWVMYLAKMILVVIGVGLTSFFFRMFYFF